MYLTCDPSTDPHTSETAQSPRRIAPLTSSLHLRLRFTHNDTPSRGKIISKSGARCRGGAGRGRILTSRCVSTAGSKSNRMRLSENITAFLHTIIAAGLREVICLLHSLLPPSLDLVGCFLRKPFTRSDQLFFYKTAIGPSRDIVRVTSCRTFPETQPSPRSADVFTFVSLLWPAGLLSGMLF